MPYPEFFNTAPTITLYDPLAELLGAAENGLIEYQYLDAVKLAGHSCPTVAGAWLMTIGALRALYPDETPERGNVIVEFAEDALAGVTGVIANVVGLVTGATTDTGFKGLGGRFDRRHLMAFGVDVPGEIAFTRRDTGASVVAAFNARSIPMAQTAMPLLQAILAGRASPEQAQTFGLLWQARVKDILAAADDPNVVTLSEPTISHAT